MYLSNAVSDVLLCFFVVVGVFCGFFFFFTFLLVYYK